MNTEEIESALFNGQCLKSGSIVAASIHPFTKGTIFVSCSEAGCRCIEESLPLKSFLKEYGSYDWKII